MSTLKVNEVRHLSNSGTANMVLESNANTNLQTTSTLGLTVNGTLTVSGVATFNGNAVIGNASTDTLTLTSTVSGSSNFSGFTGEIRMYAGNADGNSPPAGWLYCNGDTISQTSGNGGDHHNADGTGNDYQPLFNLLKASNDWGNSSSSVWGTNTVKVPDFRSRSPVGVHTGASNSIASGLTARTLGDTAGTETHTLVTGEMPAHNHGASAATSTTGMSASSVLVIEALLPNHLHSNNLTTASQSTSTTSSNGAHQHDLRQGYVDGSESHLGLGSAWAGAERFWGDAHITSAGAHTHTLSHTHTITGNSGNPTTNPSVSFTGASNSGSPSVTTTLSDGGHTHTITTTNTGGGSAHTILSPIIAVNYIIKV
mgnify:CR=1 FL=1